MDKNDNMLEYLQANSDVSVPQLQTKFQIGYSKAKRILDDFSTMQELGDKDKQHIVDSWKIMQRVEPDDDRLVKEVLSTNVDQPNDLDYILSQRAVTISGLQRHCNWGIRKTMHMIEVLSEKNIIVLPAVRIEKRTPIPVLLWMIERSDDVRD
jgi:hypothetical protein